MSTSQSTSSLEERQVYCYFLERTHDENGDEKWIENRSIFFSFLIPSIDNCPPELIGKNARTAIKNKYPGVEMIDLYLSKTIYDRFIKQAESNETYVCLNRPDFFFL